MSVDPAPPAALLAAVLATALVGGCTANAASERTAMSVVVVCPTAGADGHLSCAPVLRAERFDRWAEAALDRPGSSFVVWAAGDARGTARRRAVVEVPERWGAGVMATKAAFVARARERVVTDRAPPSDEVASASEVTAVASTGAATTVVVLGAGTEDAARWVAAAERGPASHLAVVCDHSDSTFGVTCDAAGLDVAFRGWLAAGGAGVGSSFEVTVAGRTRDGATEVFAIVTPERSQGERLAILLGARRELAGMAAGLPATAGSAIAEAVSVAGERLVARPGRRALVLMSDLRQVTRGRWNFERAIPTSAAFAAWIERAALAVDLGGVVVRACGPHHRAAPGARHFDARLARGVVEVWAAALGAAGATDVRIAPTCTESDLAP